MVSFLKYLVERMVERQRQIFIWKLVYSINLKYFTQGQPSLPCSLWPLNLLQKGRQEFCFNCNKIKSHVSYFRTLTKTLTVLLLTLPSHYYSHKIVENRLNSGKQDVLVHHFSRHWIKALFPAGCNEAGHCYNGKNQQEQVEFHLYWSIVLFV